MIIPFSRVYRAFPELDRFSDDECDRFVSLAQRSFRGAYVFMQVTNIVLFILLCVAGTCLSGMLYSIAHEIVQSLEIDGTWFGLFWFVAIIFVSGTA